MEDKLVAHEGLVLVVWQCLGIFYSKNRMGVLQDPVWLQGALNVLICLFWWYTLVANNANSKSIACQSGAIRSGIL